LAYPDGPVQRITNDPNNYEEISLADKSNTLVTMQTEVRANLWLGTAPVNIPQVILPMKVSELLREIETRFPR